MPITSQSNYTQNGTNLGSILIDVAGGVGGGGGITIEVAISVQNSYFQCVGGTPTPYISVGDNDVVWRIANYTGSAEIRYDWQRPVPDETTQYVVVVRAPNDAFHMHWGYVPPYFSPVLSPVSSRQPLEVDPRMLEDLKKLLPKPKVPKRPKRPGR